MIPFNSQIRFMGLSIQEQSILHKALEVEIMEEEVYSNSYDSQFGCWKTAYNIYQRVELYNQRVQDVRACRRLKKKGMTQKKIGSELNLSRITVQRYLGKAPLNDKPTEFDLLIHLRVAAVLN